MNLIRDRLNEPESPEVVNFDSSAYMLDLSSSQAVLPPDISGLPTLDRALYLTNTVKFHVCQTFSLFDENEFTKTLHDFYDSPVEVAARSRLWYVQFLLVIAFAKAFLQQGRIDSKPPGSVLFVRGMNLLPHSEVLYSEPVLAIETLCMISLYMQSVEMRCSAYSYVSNLFEFRLTTDQYSDWTSAANCSITRYASRDASRMFWRRALPAVASHLVDRLYTRQAVLCNYG
jgi:proline utilization trans-activator